MSDTINSSEWYTLNSITSSIYNSNFDNLFDTALDSIKSLIPYSHSLTYLLRNEEGSNISFNFKSREISEEYIQLYIDKYSRLDFINWYSNTCPTDVFRESDIIPDHLRENTVFAKNWMVPIGIYYGVGIMLYYEGIYYGAIFLYRPKEDSDFTDKELEILKVICNHLSMRAHQLYPEGLEQIFTATAHQVRAALCIPALTKREQEIVNCIKNNTLRRELCDALFITENTLNKHLDNIYKKLNINSYEELLQVIKKS